MTPFGATEISALNAGDRVKVYDPAQGTFPERSIIRILSYRRRCSLCITLANRSCLHLTPNHNILADGQWVRASALKKGAVVSTIAKGERDAMLVDSEVVEVDEGRICEVVYNPIVENSFSLIADGVITHNFNRFKQVKMLYWTWHARYRIKWSPFVQALP